MMTFFPFRLIADQVKYNIALVGTWILLLAVIFGGVGRVYGIHYLFLDPEYLHTVGFFSFWWVGLALGNFVMSFHITSYILLGHRYPFIGILEKPFTKFTINNGIIPLLVLIIYFIKISWFHWGNTTISRWEIIEYLAGLFAGLSTMIFLVLGYLQWTNKDIFRFLAGSVDKRLRKNAISRERMMQRYKESRDVTHQVTHYLDGKVRVRNCERLHDFPDRASILKVFDQNHINSVIFEFIIIFSLLMLGVLVEYPWAQIPAAASALMLFSMMMMLIGAVSFWFRGWGVSILLLIFLVFNLLSRVGIFSSHNAAIGLDYQKTPASYDLDRLNEISSITNYQDDKNHLIATLNNWKAHYSDTIKPVLVMLCVSGGGQRAALWTLATLQHVDQQINQKLMNHTFSITGASGGMIGAAYYRELFLQQQEGQSLSLADDRWVRNIGRDNLNALVFSLIANDIFIDIKKVEDADLTYYADRGTLFEHNLNRNLEGIFTKRLIDYRQLEKQADIPMMILSPVAGNDGRKLYISSSPVAYMTVGGSSGDNERKIRGLDFQRMFATHRSDSLTMLSALRMSASFPYITPTIRLPSNPPLEVMDAGISDNFGIGDALHISHVAKDWINENTSGVALVIIRDTRKISPIEPLSNPSLVSRIVFPIASVYNNLSNIQDLRNDQAIEYASSWLDVPLHTISFEYDAVAFAGQEEQIILEQNRLNTQELARASLSWHLTAQEKRNILLNLKTPGNQRSFGRLKQLLTY